MILGKFGIAHPIPNNRWNRMKAFSGDAFGAHVDTLKVDLDLAHIFGGPSDTDRLFAITYLSGIDHCYAGWGIMRMLLGPSSNASYLGKVEDFAVITGGTSSVASRVMVDKTITNTYNAHDPVTVMTLTAPAGWAGDTPGNDRKAFYFGRTVENSVANMYASPYNFSILNATANSSANASLLLLPLAPYTRYRIDVHYKNENNGGTKGPIIGVIEKTSGAWSAITASLVYCDNLSGNWMTGYAIFVTSNVPEGHALFVNFSQTGTNLTATHISSIAITHASHDLNVSGGGTVYSEDGVSTPIDSPSLGSVQIIRNHVGNEIAYDSFGYPVIKEISRPPNLPVVTYQIQYTLSGIEQSRWDVIDSLLSWQKKGFLINHFPGIAGLPYCLTGQLDGSITKQLKISDLSLLEASLVFNEVLI
jgi:hypothetical protein